MDEARLADVLREIPSPDREAMELARARQARLAKPPGSLGQLEEISVRLAGITGDVCSRVDRRRVIVLCADNGVTAEGVSSTPRSVTAAQAVNMTKRLTGMSCLAASYGDDVLVVDVGIATPYRCDAILDRKIACGTGNILREPAMSRETALRAVLTGVSLARQAKAEGMDAVGVGEMGIGNTTTSAAVLSALTGTEAAAVTGRGGGLTDAALARKTEVVRRAVAERAPDPADVIDVLAKVGGLDIAAMCGVFIGAARCRLPAVCDGFISAVAALCACRLAPGVRDYLFASHQSAEPGYLVALRALELRPWLALDMRLGEGIGCVLAFQLLDAACRVMGRMATFREAGIDDGYLSQLRDLRDGKIND